MVTIEEMSNNRDGMHQQLKTKLLCQPQCQR